MLDPTSYFANLGSDLTLTILERLGRKASQFAHGTPQYQALKRCYAAAEAALLPPDDSLFDTFQPILQTVLADPIVAAELSKLAKGRQPDRLTIIEQFEEAIYDRDLPDFDFSSRINAAIAAFLAVAEQEADLQGTIQTAAQRDLAAAMERLPAELETMIRRLVQEIRQDSGGDLVTGRKGNGPPLDPCPELQAKYLAALQQEAVRLPLASLEDEGAHQRSAAITLIQVYIALNTESTVSHAAAGAQEPVSPVARQADDERPLTALEAAIAQPRLVLLGDPGSGKSVFVNYLAYRLAAVHLGDRTSLPEWPAPPLPRRIILRDLAADLAAAYDLTDLAALPADEQRRTLHQAFEAHLIKHYQATFSLSAGQAERWAACLAGRTTLTIFDGLDEVAPAQLPAVRGLIEAVAGPDDGPLIVTCRVRSYQGMPPLAGFTQEQLAPFNAEQIDAFIEHWYATQARLSPALRPGERVTNLKQAAHSDKLNQLAPNPLLLTTMALVHTANVELPDQRVTLYDQAVKVLMRRWQVHKYGGRSLLDRLGVDDDLLLRGLWALAYQAHQSAAPGQRADVDEDRAIGILDRACFNRDANKARQFLEYVDQQAGLLVGRGGGEHEPRQYAFVHRTFQEYLAGCYLGRGSPDRLPKTLAAKRAEGERWYLVGQLAAEDLIYNVGDYRDVYDLLHWICPQKPPESEAEWRGLVWAGVIAAEMGPIRLQDDPHDDKLYLLDRLRSRLEKPHHSRPVDRGRTGRRR